MYPFTLNKHHDTENGIIDDMMEKKPAYLFNLNNFVIINGDGTDVSQVRRYTNIRFVNI